jgi:signal transduction histidine kinase/CheY-like chemotaxis protein
MGKELTELGTLKRYSLLLIIGWSLLIGVSLFFFSQNKLINLAEVATSIARASHDKDIVYRRWNALQGGVYVPISEYVQPNPYLDVPNKVVVTTDGLRLTLVNPAFMTRQVHELGGDMEGIKGHITSLTPISPGNEADEWERKALIKLESRSLVDFHELQTINGVPYMRYMRPMVTEEPCLKCHAKQGYKLGDVRGGISISVPMTALTSIYHRELAWLLMVHAFIWVLGLGGIIHGRVLLSRQITQRIDLHERAETAKEQAEAASKSKSEFLATMSHEIRTPLNGIMGMLQIALETPLDQEQRECLDFAHDSSRKLLTILNDILDLSRIEAGRFEVNLGEVRLSEMISSVAGIFALDMKTKGLALKLEVTEGTPDTISTDGGRLRQILFNLIGNSVKFTESGSISLNVYTIPTPAAPHSHRLIIEVADTGPGIPQDMQDKIFQPFTQLEQGPTRKHGGTGLGLSIVRRLVQQLGGELNVESDSGQGCIMYVNIPVDVMKHDSPESRVAALTHDKPSSCDILLIEDDAVNRIATRGMLQKLGYTVRTASSGSEGVDAFIAGEFDVVLMDIQMPGMDGVEALHTIRSLPSGHGRNVPILAFTAHAMAGDRERYQKEGFDGYISKPVEKTTLKEAIGLALSEKRHGKSEETEKEV